MIAQSKRKQASGVAVPVLYIIAVALILAWPSFTWLCVFLHEFSKRVN